jgi:hypothetical protein
MYINGIVVLWVLVAAWTNPATNHNQVIKIEAEAFHTEEACQAVLKDRWSRTDSDGMACKRIELGIGPG